MNELFNNVFKALWCLNFKKFTLDLPENKIASSQCVEILLAHQIFSRKFQTSKADASKTKISGL
jgi:hypothetical protein